MRKRLSRTEALAMRSFISASKAYRNDSSENRIAKSDRKFSIYEDTPVLSRKREHARLIENRMTVTESKSN
ncbi:MAG TPA: hypothetical protein VKB96_11490, partial [Gammaproteobacteria bacterium]|nr:hypothetical protein [Gammaproteobacteria bacterium]